MRNTLILAGAAALMTLSASANAQETVIIQQAPVATQSTIVIPAPVETYVMERALVPDVALVKASPAEILPNSACTLNSEA